MKPVIFGMVAAVLTTVSFIPQVIRIYRTKDARSISEVTFVAFAVGVFLWLIYGLMIKDITIILANSVTLVLILMIVVMKIIYK